MKPLTIRDAEEARTMNDILHCGSVLLRYRRSVTGRIRVSEAARRRLATCLRLILMSRH